jgi:membrane-associated phospholipid phosphatase
MTRPAFSQTFQKAFFRVPPIWIVSLELFLVAIALGRLLGAPLVCPSPVMMLYIGTSYLFPLLLLAAWVLVPLPFLIYRGELSVALGESLRHLRAAFCLGFVMWLHFHIKLWAPLLNPARYDHFYEALDEKYFAWLQPLIVWRSHWPPNVWIDSLYFNLFVLMFALSFIVHNVRSRDEFRHVFLASILVQALGAISYLIAPALGPFIYHNGANVHITEVQMRLLDLHRAMMAHGLPWLRKNTADCLAGGLAAMPSLHAAVTFVFVYYAQKYKSALRWFFWPAFVWILFAAMASAWHYGVDLVAGLLLGWFSVWLAGRWLALHEEATREAARRAQLAPVREPVTAGLWARTGTDAAD